MTHFFRLLAAASLLASSLVPAPVAAQALSFDRVLACASGDGPDQWGPTAQVFDAVGNLYVTGRFSGTIALGSTVLTATQTAPNRTRPSDTFVAKLDAAGQYVWALQLGDNQVADVYDLAVDAAGHLYLSGTFESFSLRLGGSAPVLFNSSASNEAFVAQFSSTSGQLRWARRAGGTRSDYAGKLALNAAGDVYVACQTQSTTLDFGTTTLANAYTSYFGTAILAKLSANGVWQWARPVGQGHNFVTGLQLDTQGGIYLAGIFYDSLTIGTARLTSLPIAGTSSSFSSDVFVAKTTDLGGWDWAVQGDAVTHQNDVEAGDMILDGAGHLYVVGAFSSRFGRFGNTLLANQSIVKPPNNPQFPNNFYSDAFVSRINAATGAWEWAVRYGGPVGDGAVFPIVDAQGRLYVSGQWLGGGWQLARIDPTNGTWLATQALPAIGLMTLDGQNRLNLAGTIGVTPTTFGTITLQPVGPNRGTGYLARLGSLPLAARAARNPVALSVWPNPAGGGAVWVQGPAAGQLVQVLDVLGRAVAAGHMPAAGPLRLPLALPAGVYVVRAAGQARQLVVE